MDSSEEQWKVISFCHNAPDSFGPGSYSFECLPSSQDTPDGWDETSSSGTREQCTEYLQFLKYVWVASDPADFALAFYLDIAEVDDQIKDETDQRSAFRELESIWTLRSSDKPWFELGDITSPDENLDPDLLRRKGWGRYLWNDFQLQKGSWEQVTQVQGLAEVDAAIVANSTQREFLELPYSGRKVKFFRGVCGVISSMDNFDEDECNKRYESRKLAGAESYDIIDYVIGSGRPLYRESLNTKGRLEPWNDFSREGDEFFAQGKLEEAREAYSLAISERAFPGRYAYGYSQLGHIHRSLGETVSAKKAFTKAAKLCPYSAETLVNLASTYADLNDAAPAIELSKLALFIKPNLASAYVNLGIAYRSVNMPNDAIEACERAIRLDGSNRGAGIILVLTYLDQGESEAGIARVKYLQEQSRDKTPE